MGRPEAAKAMAEVLKIHLFITARADGTTSELLNIQTYIFNLDVTPYLTCTRVDKMFICHLCCAVVHLLRFIGYQ